MGEGGTQVYVHTYACTYVKIGLVDVVLCVCIYVFMCVQMYAQFAHTYTNACTYVSHIDRMYIQFYHYLSHLEVTSPLMTRDIMIDRLIE